MGLARRSAYKWILGLVGFLCASQYVCGQAGNLPVEVIYRSHGLADARATNSPPVIDGRLDDAAWEDAEVYGQFAESTGNGVVEDQTQFRVCYDADFLYLAIRCHDRAVGAISKVVTARDGRVWLDDCVEISLDTNGDRKSFYHLVVNAVGTVYDVRVGADGKSEADWNCPVRVGTILEEQAWTVELAIPFQSIGIAKAAKLGRIGFNIGREQRSRDGLILSQWSPSLDRRGGFSHPNRFGVLCFDAGKDELRFAAEGVTLVSRKEAIELTAEMFGDVENEVRVSGQIAAMERRNWREVAETVGEDSESKTVRLSLPAVGRGEMCFIRLEMIEPGNALPYDMLTFLCRMPEYLTLKIVKPHYKNAVFAGQEVEFIEASVQNAFSGTVEVSLGGKDEVPVHRRCISDVREARTVAIPVRELPFGTSELAATLLDDDGKLLARKTERIRRLKSGGNEVRFREGGILLRNGEPVMPIGYLCVNSGDETPSLAELARQGVTVCGTYYCSKAQSRQLDAILDEAAEAGIGMLIYPYFEMGAHEANEPALSDKARAEVIEKVNRYKDHPAVVGWYLSDEPEIRNRTVSWHRDVYNLISELDPRHPCIILNDTGIGVWDYAVACDVTMPDPYIMPRKVGPPLKPMGYVAGFMDVARKTGKPFWITPQAFDYASFKVSCAETRSPNYREERCMTYLAMVRGARGFVYYGLVYTLPEADLRIGMPHLTRELRAISPAIVGMGEEKAVKTSSPVEAMARKTKDGWIVVAVNPTREKVEGKIAAAGLAGPIQVISESRTILAGGGEIRDNFEPYGVHIYTNLSGIETLPTTASIEKEIAGYREEIRRKNAGNTAFAGNGGKVTASEYQRSIWLNDGTVNHPNWHDSASPEKPAWVELTWPELKNISKVVIDATPFAYHDKRIHTCAVFVWKDDGWRKVGTFSDEKNVKKVLEIGFEPISTDRLRVEFYKPGYIIVAEIRAYGP